MIARAETSYPVGTENRCCFVCEHSNTNPALIGTVSHWLFKARASRTGTIKCLKHDYLWMAYNVCGAFQER